MATKFSPITGRYVHLTVQGTSGIASISRRPARERQFRCNTRLAATDDQWLHILEDDRPTSEFRSIAHDLPYPRQVAARRSASPERRERYNRSRRGLRHRVHRGDDVRTLAIGEGIYVGCSMVAISRPTPRARNRLIYSRAVIAVEGAALATCTIPELRSSVTICRIRAPPDMKRRRPGLHAGPTPPRTFQAVAAAEYLGL